MQEIAPGIVSFKNVFPESKDVIDSIENAVLAGKEEWKQSMVYQDGVGVVNAEARSCQFFGIPYSNDKTIRTLDNPDYLIYEISKKLKDAFSPFIEEYVNRFRVELERVYDNYSILKYGNGHRFKEHADDGANSLRRVSLLYYVNDDYEGGEILFPRWNLNIKPQANELILFPSNYMYAHEVIPVTIGTRYSVVQWIK